MTAKLVNVIIYCQLPLSINLLKKWSVASVVLLFSTIQSKVTTVLITERRGLDVDSRTSSYVGQGSRGWPPLSFFISPFPSLLFFLNITEGLVIGF